MREFSVSVLEGVNSDDIATYFCEEKPVLVQIPIEDSPEFIVFVKFIPKNGSPMRVGRPMLVPLARTMYLSGDGIERAPEIVEREYTRRIQDRPQA
jgi:hypothetical protein